MLVYDDTEFPGWITMFLLAGDLAGTATRAVIILDKKSVL
jgi:peroxiredoxin